MAQYVNQSTTNLNNDRYRINVNYQQIEPHRWSGRRPMPEVVEDKIEAIDIFNGLASGVAQALAAPKDYSKELQQLAMESNRIAEAQRQGTISSTAADTAFRNLSMSYMQRGVPEKDVHDTLSRHNWGLLANEEARQKALVTNEMNNRKAYLDQLQAENPVYRGMSYEAMERSLDIGNSTYDNFKKYQARTAQLTPQSPEYNLARQEMMNAASNNLLNNLQVNLGLMVEEAGQLTPEVVNAMRIRLTNYVQGSLGLSPTDTASLVENTINKSGIRGLAGDYSSAYKLSTEDYKLKTENIQAAAKYGINSIPGYAVINALTGQAGEQLMANRVANEQGGFLDKFTADIFNGIKTNTGERATSGYLNYQDVPSMIKGMNNAMNNPSTSPYIKGSIAVSTVELLNKALVLPAGANPNQINTALMNAENAENRMRTHQLKQLAESLKNQPQADVQEQGYDLEQRLQEEEALKEIAKLRSPLRSKNAPALNRVVNSMNFNLLRYDEDGNIFLTSDEDAGNVLNTAATIIDMPFKDFDKAVKDLQQDLSRYTPELRTQILKNMGMAPAKIGERPAEVETDKGLVENLRARADALEESTNNLSPAAMKEYGEGNRAAIKRAREAADKLEQGKQITATSSISNSETLAFADMDYSNRYPEAEIWKTVEEGSAADAKRENRTGEFDTKLSGNEENSYQLWKQSLPQQLQSEADYDLRGYYQEHGTEDTDGHLTDKYKKPNHPTFSVESKYYKKGMWAGKLDEDGNFKIPLDTPKEKLKQLIEYWRSGAESEALLKYDNPKAEKEVDKLEAKLNRYRQQLNDERESADVKRHIRREREDIQRQLKALYNSIYIDTLGE